MLGKHLKQGGNMPRKPNQPSKTSLAQEAKQCVFDPRANGPMKIIADTGNADYYETRAVEAIYQSKLCHDNESCIEQLRQAVGLLLLSINKRVQSGQSSQERQQGS